MPTQILDRRTIGIPGPAGDASPEMIAAAEARAAATAAQLLPGEVAAQVQAQLTPALVDAAREGAADAIAQNPAVIDAARDLAQSDAGLARLDDPRFSALGGPDGSNAWVDSTGRASLYDDSEGRVHAPLSIVSPGVGVPMDTTWDDGTLWDPVTGQVREGSTIGGRVPQSTLSAWAGRMGLGGSRTVPALVTGSGGSSIRDNAPAVHARALVQVPRWASRVRIHARNYNDRDSVQYGPVTDARVMLGRPVRVGGEPTSAFVSAPVEVLPTGTISGVAESVGPWVDVQGGGLMMVSYTYRATGDSHAGIAAGWRSTATAEVADLTPATPMTYAKQLPLDLWLEVEIPQWVRIVAVITDSHGLASNAETPIIDAFTVKWAESAGVALMAHSNHGSGLSSWADTSQWKWQKYAGLSRPDAAVVFVGSNSIFDGLTLATMQGQFGQVVDAVRHVLCDGVLAGTLFARGAAVSTAARDAVRVAYNDWVRGLPAGIISCFDISTVLEDPASSAPVVPRPEYITSDSVHLTRRGHALAAARIPIG